MDATPPTPSQLVSIKPWLKFQDNINLITLIS